MQEPDPPAMRLDLFSLKLFVDIVDLRSIGKGAAKNCIAISAASKRMADLEHALGAQLLHRQSRGVVTTDAGDTLYKGMTETLSRLQQVAAAVTDQAKGRKRPVRLYSNLTALVHQLPEALRAFTADHPDIPIELEEQTTAATLLAVSRGDADIGIVAPILPYPANVVSFRYQVMRHVLAVPRGHALAACGAASFDKAAEHDFIGLESEGGWDQLLRKVADERGCEFRVRVRVNSFDAMCRMVAGGLGIAIVPEPTVAMHAQALGLERVTLDEPWADMPLDVCSREESTLTCAGRLLLDHLRHHRVDHPASAAARRAPTTAELKLMPTPADRAVHSIAMPPTEH
jgi:DNA-binding transcriptional LysR family regulator